MYSNNRGSFLHMLSDELLFSLEFWLRGEDGELTMYASEQLAVDPLSSVRDLLISWAQTHNISEWMAEDVPIEVWLPACQ